MNLTMGAKLEESFGRRKFIFDHVAQFKEYEKRMLCDSGCPYTLPMFFLYEEGNEKVYYDFTGFIQVEEYVNRGNLDTGTNRDSPHKIREALEILYGILVSLKNMECYLLHPERISLHHELFFFQPVSGQIRVAYYPEEKSELTLQKRLIDLIQNITDLYSNEESIQYLRKFIDLTVEKNLGLDGMINCLGTIQREVSYIYCNTNDLRGNNKNQPPLEVKMSEAIQFKKPFLTKSIVVHGVIAGIVLAVFLAGALEIMQFTGLMILAAAAEVMIARRKKI